MPHEEPHGDKPRSFEDLVAEGVAVSTEGWDFSWFEGRATEERPSWGYAVALADRLAAATAALDIQTGGGEVLAFALGRAVKAPALTAATEGRPPNVARATALLRPRGTLVVAVPEDAPLPFADGAFDLVSSRHPVTPHWAEIARVLEPGGTYFAQHVGPGSVYEPRRVLPGTAAGPVAQRPPPRRRTRPCRGRRPGDRRPARRAAAHRVPRHRGRRALPSQGGLDGPRLHRRGVRGPPPCPARTDRGRGPVRRAQHPAPLRRPQATPPLSATRAGPRPPPRSPTRPPPPALHPPAAPARPPPAPGGRSAARAAPP